MLLNKGIPFRFIINKIWKELIYVSLIALVVFYFTDRYRSVIPVMPLSIPAFLGTAISVILSFKLNQSYDRWWEARKIWGSIVNDSRIFILQLQSFVKKGNEGAISAMAHRHIAWNYCLGQSLRGQDPVLNLDKYLSSGDLDELKQHNNKPLAILQLNTLQIQDLKQKEQMDIFSQIQLVNTLAGFTNSMGMAERINKTIFPATYRLFLHFFIYIFVITLCIALRDIDTQYEIPLLLVISAAFFLLEKSATHLQDPFSNQPTDTPMTAIATTIELNIRELLHEKDVPQVTQPDRYYIL